MESCSGSDSEASSYDEYDIEIDEDDYQSTLEALQRVLGVDITLEDVVELMAAVERNVMYQYNTPQKKKNASCKFFLMGRCTKGEFCNYRHDVNLESINKTPMEQRLNKKPILCKFFQAGSCLKGDSCNYSHDVKTLEVIVETTPQKDGELSCSICLENCESAKKRFGLLNGCDHVFCLECIREWRKQIDSQVVRSCPLCRKQSHYVIPSTIFATGEAKKKIELLYLTSLRDIPCKYFKKVGKCPFGDNCFYVH